MRLFFEIVMGLVSVVGMTFIIERGLALRWNRVIPRAIEHAVNHCGSEASRLEVRRACEANPSPIGRLLLTADENLGLIKEEKKHAPNARGRKSCFWARPRRARDRRGHRSAARARRNHLRNDDSLRRPRQSARRQRLLAKGISLILNFTMMGLLIAIPSLIAWNYYTKKVEMLAVEMESVCAEFLRRLYHEQAFK
jgi:biopolymer transport protein ExbB